LCNIGIILKKIKNKKKVKANFPHLCGISALLLKPVKSIIGDYD